MSSAPSSSMMNRAVSWVTLRANGFPVRRAQCAYTRNSSPLS